MISVPWCLFHIFAHKSQHMAGLLGTIASDVGVAAVVPQALHGIIKITKLCRRRRATSHDETAVECPSQH